MDYYKQDYYRLVAKLEAESAEAHKKAMKEATINIPKKDKKAPSSPSNKKNK